MFLFLFCFIFVFFNSRFGLDTSPTLCARFSQTAVADLTVVFDDVSLLLVLVLFAVMSRLY